MIEIQQNVKRFVSCLEGVRKRKKQQDEYKYKKKFLVLPFFVLFFFRQKFTKYCFSLSIVGSHLKKLGNPLDDCHLLVKKPSSNGGLEAGKAVLEKLVYSENIERFMQLRDKAWTDICK